MNYWPAGVSGEPFPMRWPARWRDPALLKLLENIPVNVLLLPAGVELTAVRAVAQREGLACWEVADTGEVSSPQQKLRIVPRGELDWNAGGPIVAARDCVWPSVAAESASSAGPTGVPWVDSNGWFAQLARTMLPGRQVWLFFDPPERTVLGPNAYQLAAADAEAFGAHWAVALDEEAQARPERAALILQQIATVLRFFERRREWRDWPPRSALGVLSDFSGDHRHLAEEILNLLARRHLPYRVLDKRAPDKLVLDGLKAVIYPDSQPPDRPLEQLLLAFVRRGGLLIAGPSWRARTGRPRPPDVHGRFHVLAVGNGRLAIAKEAFSDPYLVALDAHLLLGRRHDPIRLWNGGSLNAHYVAQPGGRRAVVHLVNYSARRPAHSVTLGVNAPFRRAQLWEPGVDQARPLQILPAPQGVEVPLPEFRVYAAIELEA